VNQLLSLNAHGASANPNYKVLRTKVLFKTPVCVLLFAFLHRRKASRIECLSRLRRRLALVCFNVELPANQLWNLDSAAFLKRGFESNPFSYRHIIFPFLDHQLLTAIDFS